MLFFCTNSVMNISNSPECLLLQDFHLHQVGQEDHGLLADQEHQEYQKVPVESQKEMTRMNRAQHGWILPRSSATLMNSV